MELLGNKRTAVFKVLSIFICSIFFGLFLVFLSGCGTTKAAQLKILHEMELISAEAKGYNKGYDSGTKDTLRAMDDVKFREYIKGFEEGYQQCLRTMIPVKINNIPAVKEDETDRQK